MEITFRDFDYRVGYVEKLRDKLINRLVKRVPSVIVNGPWGEYARYRVANNANISFLYIEGRL